jgi:chromosome segregation ATPase
MDAAFISLIESLTFECSADGIKLNPSKIADLNAKLGLDAKFAIGVEGSKTWVNPLALVSLGLYYGREIDRRHKVGVEKTIAAVSEVARVGGETKALTADLAGAVLELKGSIVALQSSNAALQGSVGALQGSTATLQSRLTTVEQALQEAKNTNASLQTAAAEAKLAALEAKNRVTEAEHVTSELRKTEAETKALNIELAGALLEIKSAIVGLQSSVGAAQCCISSLQKDTARNHETLAAELELKITALAGRIDDINGQSEALSESTNLQFNGVSRFLSMFKGITAENEGANSSMPFEAGAELVEKQ